MKNGLDMELELVHEGNQFARLQYFIVTHERVVLMYTDNWIAVSSLRFASQIRSIREFWASRFHDKCMIL